MLSVSAVAADGAATSRTPRTSWSGRVTVCPSALRRRRHAERRVAGAARLAAELADHRLRRGGVAGLGGVTQLLGLGAEVLRCILELRPLLPDLGLGRRLRRSQRALREQGGDLAGGVDELLRVRNDASDVARLRLVLDVLPRRALVLHELLPG